MELLADLKTVWPLINQAPWVFTTVAVSLIAVGWAAGRFLFKERMNLLEGRITERDERILLLTDTKNESIANNTAETNRRFITDTQRRRFASALVDHQVGLSDISLLFSVHGGNETRQYAQQIADALSSQGWLGHPVLPIDDDYRLTGIKLWYQPALGKTPNAARLAAALAAAEIDFDWTPHEPPYADTIIFVYRLPD